MEKSDWPYSRNQPAPVGKQYKKKKGYFRQEYAYQSFTRTIPFPVPVAADDAEAEVKDGVLIITVPKAEPEKPKTKKLAIKKK